MRLSHADYRPGKRPRFVPSGPPRRKFPLIRIVLLLALGLFIYARFDSLWTMARTAAAPLAIWNKTAGSTEGKNSGSSALTWSGDSSRVTVSCPRGLDATCCEHLDGVERGLCGSARAVLGHARWRGALKPAREAASGRAEARPQQWEARAVVSDLGDWGYELSGLRGRDDAGSFAYRRAAGASWCEPRRGCLSPALKPARARAPLADGRLVEFGGAEGVRGGATVVTWISSSPRVRAVLPGRIVSVDASPRATESDGSDASARPAVVRVYHGAELYATYDGIVPAAGVQPGALVKAGSWLGDLAATRAGAGAGGYLLSMSLRQAGQPADAALLWEQAPVPEAPLVSARSPSAGDPKTGRP